MSDKTYYEENNENRRQAIIKEWDLARLSEDDKSIDKPLRLILKYGKIMEIKSKNGMFIANNILDVRFG